MKLTGKHISQFNEYTTKANNILLLCHKKPDADAIGAALTLHGYLEKLGKKVTSCSIDKVSEFYYFLPKVYLMKESFGKPEDYDLIIVLDCGDSKITGFHKEFPKIFSGNTPVLNIDHHITNDMFGDVNIVIPEASSTTHILYKMFKTLRIEIDSDMAILILAGLYYDTGSFKHDNTTAEVLLIASKLVHLGAKAEVIAKNMFKNHSVETLRVWGRVFSNMKKNDQNIISSILREEDLIQCGLDPNNLHLSEIMNYLDSIPNTKFSVLLTEVKGFIKGSFRTSSNSIDVAQIAKYFKGGGHKKAAGFVMKGKIEDVQGKLAIS